MTANLAPDPWIADLDEAFTLEVAYLDGTIWLMDDPWAMAPGMTYEQALRKALEVFLEGEATRVTPISFSAVLEHPHYRPGC